MKDTFAADVAVQGDSDEIRVILEDVCRITGMGFAAVARVTEDRWIACQVLDKIEFGLEPGQELAIKTTICDDIRQCGAAIVIDHVAENPEWRTHPTPMLYGFESYASFPIVLANGDFYGTLCAIDPEPHAVASPVIVEAMEAHATRIAALLRGEAALPRVTPAG